MPAVAYLLGWDWKRAAQLRLRAFTGALAFGAALGGAALAAGNVLPGALGAPEWERVRPTDNAAAPSSPEGKTAVVMRDWWRRQPVGRGDLVYLETGDLPPERAAFAGITVATRCESLKSTTDAPCHALRNGTPQPGFMSAAPPAAAGSSHAAAG